MDNDTLVLKDANACVLIIDVQYKLADFTTKLQLKEKRDKAFDAYSMARLKLLTDAVICTDADVQQMQQLRQEVEQAADTQTLINGIIRFVRFLVAL